MAVPLPARRRLAVPAVTRGNDAVRPLTHSAGTAGAVQVSFASAACDD